MISHQCHIWLRGAALLLPLLLGGAQVQADAAGCFSDECHRFPGRVLEGPVPPERTFRPYPVTPEGYPIPRGGSYVRGGDVANLPEHLTNVLRVSAFDAVRDPIVIAGQPLHPDQLPKGWRVFDHSGSAQLWTGGDGAIVLRGVPQADWAAGVLGQTQGTAGNDVMVGAGSANEVFVPGGGLDRVAPAAGDDKISFASGYLVITNDPPNVGTDSLDLRRFGRADIRASVEGDDALIFTTDGTIRLEQQFLPHSAGNVEQVLLADDDILLITTADDFSVSVGGN